ncbi:MAG: DedA family protein [Acidobacteria bacterium]|nr:DedA family protein [Acidobacteriota bacterium]
MDALREFLDFLFHAENHLRAFIESYGAWVYALLFAIIFCETGLVVMPFLPGDSLLFAVGALASQGMMDIGLLWVLLVTAGILGDSVNYSIGRYLGPKVFHYESSFFFKREHLMKAHAFYEKYGGRAIVLARFVPIVRTFAPFVAGIGTMEYRRFVFYNVFGAVLWVTLFLGAGYLFGSLPVVKENMKIVIVGIIVVSVLPMVWEYFKARAERRAAS